MNESGTSRGPGFLALLGLLFIGLKLGGVIDWTWWLVLLPLYAPVLVLVVLLLFVALPIATIKALRT